MSWIENRNGREASYAAGSEWSAPESQREKLALLPKLVPVYQKAFAGEPWYEVSKCGCPRCYSAQKVGEVCEGGCGQMLTEEAYPAKELLQSLKSRVLNNPSFVYAEAGKDGKAVLGAIAYQSSPRSIYESKYKGRENEEVREALASLPGKIVWLDEIFADRDRRPQGNLANFKSMCQMMAMQLGTGVIAFRSINERLIGKAESIFGDACTVRVIEDPGTVEGMSAFVVIDLRK